MKVSIIGGGSWGATLAEVLADNNHEVLIREIDPERVRGINEENQHPFFDVKIAKTIKATLNIEEACNFSNVIILSVPTGVMRDVLTELKPLIKNPKIFVNVSKGIEPDTLLCVSQIIKEVIPKKLCDGIVTLSGPSHAEEVIEKKLTVLVSASKNKEKAIFIQHLFSNDKYMRVYTSKDIIGVEVGAAVKNAIALVSGIASGLGFGENARAALISRGIIEIEAIARVLGGKKDTVYGLTGVGDLIVTASSQNSRNFQAGYRVGRGESFTSVLKSSKMVVEGARTLISAYEIALKYKLDVPILKMTYAVLYENVPASEIIVQLLNRKLKPE